MTREYWYNGVCDCDNGVCDCQREEAPKFFSAWDKLKRDYPECISKELLDAN